MDFRGLALRDLQMITEQISTALYGGNVLVHPDARDRGRGCRGRIYVSDSSGPGARTSASGRRGPYACFHAVRDVLDFAFQASPNMVVHTMHATYRRRHGFLDTYPVMGQKNIGSMMEPVRMPDLCKCSNHIRNRQLTVFADVVESANRLNLRGGHPPLQVVTTPVIQEPTQRDMVDQIQREIDDYEREWGVGSRAETGWCAPMYGSASEDPEYFLTPRILPEGT